VVEGGVGVMIMFRMGIFRYLSIYWRKVARGWWWYEDCVDDEE
jgi:hypothetical protein